MSWAERELLEHLVRRGRPWQHIASALALGEAEIKRLIAGTGIAYTSPLLPRGRPMNKG